MNKKIDLSQLVLACQAIGNQAPYWVQGGGGNLSRKIGNQLWIKSSGLRLSEVTKTSGLVALDDTKLLGAWEEIHSAPAPNEAYFEVLRKTVTHTQNGERPSMESIVHAVLPGRWVLHFHPLTAILIASQSSRWAAFQKIASQQGLKIAKVPYTEPGWQLGVAVSAFKAFDVIVLENHGVILQSFGEDSGGQQMLKRWAECERQACLELGLPVVESAAKVLSPTPWHIYFPDAAVFEDRVLKVVKSESNGLYSLPETAWSLDQAAAEIFYATQMIWLTDPHVPVLSHQTVQALKNMVFEKLRRTEKAKGEAA